MRSIPFAGISGFAAEMSAGVVRYLFAMFQTSFPSEGTTVTEGRPAEDKGASISRLKPFTACSEILVVTSTAISTDSRISSPPVAGEA